MTPHKHAELIKKWADGHTIQWRISEVVEWESVKDPSWNPNYQYRVKPVAKRYRVVLLQKKGRTYTLTADTEEEVENLKECVGFVRFLTDWIEYEV